MGTIQSGQILNKPTTGGTITSGRIARGITSYDESIRQKYFSDIEAQKKAYEDEVAKQKAEIDATNAEIDRKNAELKAKYDTAVENIKNMSLQEYSNYYYTIPTEIRNLFETPEQITQRVQVEKQTRATETLSAINEQISNYQDKYNYWNEQYRIRSGDGAEYADQHRIEAQFHIEELTAARQYATGDYDTQEIINTANQRASDRFTRNELSVEYSRLQEREVAKAEAEGYIPIYKYPKDINKELIGYAPAGTSQEQISTYRQSFISPIIGSSIKTTELGQNVLNLGSSQALAKNEYYVDALGQPISYDPSLANKNINKYEPFNFIFNQRQAPKQDILGQPISMLPKKPISTITKAPTLFQTFKSVTKKKGYVEGTLSFFGERFASAYDLAIQRGYTSPERQESIRTGLSLLPQASYFTPAGNVLFIGSGTEKVIKGEGSKDIFGLKVPTKVIGGAEVVLGTIGLKSQVSGIIEARTLKQFEKAPTLYKGGVIETEKGGLYTLYGKKVFGKSTFETYIEQPFKNLESGKSIMESGKGISLTTIKGKPTTFTMFETGGKTIPIETMPKITSINKLTKVTRPIEAESSISRLYTQQVFTGKVTKVLDNKIFITGEKIKTPKIYESFLNIGKESEKGIGIISGKLSGLKMNVLTDVKIASAKIDSFGFIKRIKSSEEAGYSIISGTGTQTFKPYTSLSTGQVTKGLQYIQPTKSLSSFDKLGSIGAIAPKYISGVEIQEPTKSIYSSKGNILEDVEYSKSLPKVKTIEILDVTPKLKGFNIESVKPLTTTDLSYYPLLKSPQKQEPEVLLKQPQEPKFKQPLAYKQFQEPKYKQPQIFKDINIFKQAPKTPQIPKIPSTQKVSVPKLPPIFKVPKQSKQIKNIDYDKVSKAFTVLIRSKGKVKEIGKDLPYYKALKLGVEKTKSSLAQTFALREAGTTKTKDIFYRVPANLFTTPKRKKTFITDETFVERRGKTLTEFREVKGLQQSKKGKKIKWL